MKDIDNQRYREEQRQVRRSNYKYYHYCGECGYYSKKKLIYGHTKKDRLVCEACRKKLWDIK